MLLIGNGRVLTPNGFINDGAVCVDANLIKEVGTLKDLRVKYPTATYLNAGGGIIMPGLVNCHMHLYSTFARGLALKGVAPKNFTEILKKLWWRLDKSLTKEDVYYSALIPLIECVKSGTTTIIDHHASPSFVLGSLDTIAEAMKLIPLRVSLCYEVSDRDGAVVADAGIKENLGFIYKYIDHETIKGLFGLHASFTVSDKTLKRCVEAAKGMNCGFHVHTSEDKSDKKAVTRWDKFGLLGPKTVLAHCVHVSDKELDLIRRTKTNIVHNPESNMNNAVGAADIIKMLAKKITVGLGTDGMTSDMFTEAKFAHLIRKHLENDPRVGFVEAGEMLFNHNPKILEKLFGWKIGRIESGFLADIVISGYRPATDLNADNFLGHFLYAMDSSNIETTIVHGRVLMQNKKLLGVDEDLICAKARDLSRKLWARL